MADDKINYSEEKPSPGITPGAYKAHSIGATINKTGLDRKGNSWHQVLVEFEYDPGTSPDEMPTQKALFMLPYDNWKDGSDGGPISPFKQFLDSTEKKPKDFNGKSVSESFANHDVTILVGAMRDWKTNEVKMWGDNGDKINYGIVGFAPFAKGAKAWTKEMEANEEKIKSEALGQSAEPVETQVGFTPEPDPSQSEIATVADVEEAFKEEPKKEGAW